MVDRNGWMDAHEFQDANAACQLLPGPASTQLAMFCAYRVAGPAGAIVGGLGFIAPAVILIIALSVLFLSADPPEWVRGAGAGAGAAVVPVALAAARGLLAPNLGRLRSHRAEGCRFAAYLLAGVAGATLLGPELVLVLVGCGLLELVRVRRVGISGPLILLIPGSIAVGGLGALAWTAFKVGVLSFGGGFVIIPLMQGDAVHTHHWMTNAQFLNAVALGQVTPGPVVATVAAVGYAAHGVLGGILAAAIAFGPSFSFILLGGPRFEAIRANAGAQAFLDGAGPAAIGAIIGAAILLAAALPEAWQFAVLAGAAAALLIVRRGVVETLLAAGVTGVLLGLLGAPLPG